MNDEANEKLKKDLSDYKYSTWFLGAWAVGLALALGNSCENIEKFEETKKDMMMDIYRTVPREVINEEYTINHYGDTLTTKADTLYVLSAEQLRDLGTLQP